MSTKKRLRTHHKDDNYHHYDYNFDSTETNSTTMSAPAATAFDDDDDDCIVIVSNLPLEATKDDIVKFIYQQRLNVFICGLDFFTEPDKVHVKNCRLQFSMSEHARICTRIMDRLPFMGKTFRIESYDSYKFRIERKKRQRLDPIDTSSSNTTIPDLTIRDRNCTIYVSNLPLSHNQIGGKYYIAIRKKLKDHFIYHVEGLINKHFTDVYFIEEEDDQQLVAEHDGGGSDGGIRNKQACIIQFRNERIANSVSALKDTTVFQNHRLLIQSWKEYSSSQDSFSQQQQQRYSKQKQGEDYEEVLSCTTATSKIYTNNIELSTERLPFTSIYVINISRDAPEHVFLEFAQKIVQKQLGQNERFELQDYKFHAIAKTYLINTATTGHQYQDCQQQTIDQYNARLDFTCPYQAKVALDVLNGARFYGLVLFTKIVGDDGKWNVLHINDPKCTVLISNLPSITGLGFNLIRNKLKKYIKDHFPYLKTRDFVDCHIFQGNDDEKVDRNDLIGEEESYYAMTHACVQFRSQQLATDVLTLDGTVFEGRELIIRPWNEEQNTNNDGVTMNASRSMYNEGSQNGNIEKYSISDHSDKKENNGIDLCARIHGKT